MASAFRRPERTPLFVRSADPGQPAQLLITIMVVIIITTTVQASRCVLHDIVSDSIAHRSGVYNGRPEVNTHPDSREVRLIRSRREARVAAQDRRAKGLRPS